MIEQSSEAPASSHRAEGADVSQRRARRVIAAALAMSLATGGASAETRPPAAAKAPAASVNIFQEQAGRLGVRKCANLFAAMGETVSHGSSYTVQALTERAAPDGHGVQGVVGMTYNTPGYSAQAAGIVMAAPVGGKCEGQLVRVAPFQRACKDVVALLPAGSTAAGSLSGVPLYTLGSNQGQAMLVSSGGACVVVTVARGADFG
ncbi:hypothetical protein [Sphingomonas sp. DT-204]|uniref:hypothetical protein n=1 Tax=Sphingomonas sp. DT-204 TaxID=3396166 RepID=UPI003F1C7CF7